MVSFSRRSWFIIGNRKRVYIRQNKLNRVEIALFKQAAVQGMH